MGKWFLVIFLLVILVFGAVALWILTFDVNSLKLLIADKVESSTGQAVQMGKISLTWQNGVALALENFKLYPDRDLGKEPIFQVELAKVELQLLPLLRREIQMGGIVIENPRVYFVKSRDGVVQFLSGTREVKSSGPQKGLEIFSTLFIHSIEIHGGEIVFRDETVIPVRVFYAKEVDIGVRNFSLTQPLRLKAKMGLWSDRQNISFEGEISPILATQSGKIRSFELEGDLSSLKLKEIEAWVPELSDLAIEGDVQGKFYMNIREGVFDASNLERLDFRADLKEGSIKFAALKDTLKDIRISLEGTLREAQYEFSAKLAQGKIDLSGTLDGFRENSPVTFKGAVQNLILQELIYQPAGDSPRLEGEMNLSAGLQSDGLNEKLITKTLRGSGNALMEQGVIRNLNVSREILKSLTMIPGLSERLESRLSEAYLEKLKNKDTFLEPIEIPFQLEGDVISSNRLLVRSENFVLEGNGQFNMNGSIACRFFYLMDPDMSNAFIRSINELQYLADTEGRLKIPVSVSGTLDRLRIMPDLQYVASRLAVQKAQEWIGSWIEKGKPTGINEPSPKPRSEESSYADLVGGLLQSAFQTTQKRNASDSAPS
ncbi:MAG: AsmA family protein [Candidatus Omnitrophica bacterium]|nr:AsmA family protein [Candidatus Omnitrophota bacterium]